MNHIRSTIDNSKKWKFDRRIFVDNKLEGRINNGTLSWIKINDNIFDCIEEGVLELNGGHKGVFYTKLKFIFDGNDFKVFKSNNTMFYQSTKNNVYSSKTNDILIELKFIKKIITFRYDLHTKNSLKTEITNYYY
tara:strand:+ start:555 stop:959 length:405 start_codon:yes stop_codon:yes gene_type:complete